MRGPSYAGDIALDDLQVKSGLCPPPDACSFEQNDLCGWKNEPTADDFDWTKATGGTASVNTGPSADHTFGTTKGKVMMMMMMVVMMVMMMMMMVMMMMVMMMMVMMMM